MEFKVLDFGQIELDFDVDFKIDDNLSINSRIHKPKYYKPLKSKYIKYDNAVKLAKKINLSERTNCILSGNFIFGDFIEALAVEKNMHIERLVISTLSISQENVDSLKNLLVGDYVDRLDLLVSSYFWSHERWKLVPYIFKELDIDNKFQLAVSANHCKIVLIKTYSGDNIVIHGSSNLRSSDCLEQISIENDKDLFDFHMDFLNTIVERFPTIDKEIKGNRGKKLWQTVEQEHKEKQRA